MMHRLWLGAALAALAPTIAPAQTAPPPASADAPLTVQLIRAGPGSLYASIGLIKGSHDAVLVDAPFTMADAHRVVAEVLESGLALTTVFVTHDHPDHFFAMEVIRDAFPTVKIVAHPTVVDDIWASLPLKVKRWSPMLGPNGPRAPTAPTPLDGDTILLEGRALRVIGPMTGDHAHATALWVPSIRALFAGDLLFNQVHLWLGESDAAAVTAWARSVETLAALDPLIVVAGHAKDGTANDRSSIAFTRDYLAAWPKLVAASKDSADLRRRVKARFPQTIDVLGDFILGNSSRVAMGEAPIWRE
ncbi:MAG: MBL fold metallo-hydrolase [Sphingomonas fennica]